MIAAIKNWMFDSALKSHPNFNATRSTFQGENNCQTVCILADGTSESNRKSILEYKNRLTQKCQVVDLLLYQNISSELEDGFTKKNIHWKGVPEHDSINMVLAKKYDVFIFLSDRIEVHMEYVIRLIQAKLKIGPGIIGSEYLFELMVERRNYSDLSLLIKDIESSLKLITKE